MTIAWVELIQIKNQVPPTIKFIGYSWDPLLFNERHCELKIKMIRELDNYVTGDATEIRLLQQQGLNNILYAPSGFDPKVTYYVKDDNYECDVSIVCTNLYDDVKMFPLEDVRLNRKVLVDLLYQERATIKFHVYGPNFLSQLYPDCYRGFVTYANSARVFANSKINLCLHAVSFNSLNDQLYFSERLPQILGAKGLLYCETLYSTLLIPNVNYILADLIDPIGQIKTILQNYTQAYYTNIKNNGYQLAINHLTWDNLRQAIKMSC